MAGVDSLCDEADLPFNWDLSRLFNFDPDAAPVVVIDADEEKQDGGPDAFVYDYELNDVVFLRPPGQEDLPFWLGKVVSLGEGEHLGFYELWWYTSKKVFGTYHPWVDVRKKPLVDWQLQSSIQDSVKMVSGGKKISKLSAKFIRSFIQRWKQEGVADGLNLEPEVAPEDQPMDID